jgi:hypothetical protein
MAIGAVGFIYALFKKPEWLAILLFTAIIAEINFDVPGMPMNFRAITSLCLLGRVIGMPANDRYPKFFSTGYAWHMGFFVLYMMLITAKNSLLDFGVVKEFILSFVAAYLGYFFFMRQNGYQLFKWAIIFAGLTCFGDLAYTYAFVGGFPVERWCYLVVPGYEVFNHNFFGYICGAAFLFLLNDYLAANKNVKINLYLMPVMFLGVLLSTSRSSLLIMMILAMVLVVRELMSQKKGKKAYTLISITFVCLLITLFIFQIIQEFIASDSEFLKQITGRLIDEPVAILNRALGNNYNANNLDSMDWRAEASALAYYRFVNLIPEEQLFGIGYNGFLARDYGFAYDAHNGILLVMIEFGILGFLVYYSLLIFMIIKSIRIMKLASPFTMVLVYMILYVASHNKELTAFFCFLVHGSLAAHIQIKLHEGEIDEVQIAEIEPNPA